MADTMRAVNRLACLLLIVCMTLLSAGAHAHGVGQTSHPDTPHSPHAAVQIQVSACIAAPASLGSSLDAHAAHDACAHAHCCHVHGATLSKCDRFKLLQLGSTLAPQTRRVRLPSTPPNEIERPKWSHHALRGEFALT